MDPERFDYSVVLDDEPPRQEFITDEQLDSYKRKCFQDKYEQLVDISAVNIQFKNNWNSIRTHRRERRTPAPMSVSIKKIFNCFLILF